MQNHFDPANVELGGLQLIEASAGTGKTFNITAAFLRLLIEKAHPIEHRPLTLGDILVVTFTEAATQELRERLRKQLLHARDTAAALRNGKDFDEADIVSRIIQGAGRPLAAVEQQLQHALRSLDELSVYTIHGFCQRVLQEQAFECGSLFRPGEICSDEELLREVVKDFWRREVLAAKTARAIKLLNTYETADKLLKQLRPLLRHKLPQILPEFDAAELARSRAPIEADLEAARTELSDAREAASELLRNERDNITSALIGMCARKGCYKSPTTDLEELEQWLASDRLTLPKDASNFLPEALENTKLGRGGKPATHDFFKDFGALPPLLQKIEQLEKTLGASEPLAKIVQLCDIAAWVKQELQRRKQQQHAYSFDDMISSLATALQSEGLGARLPDALYRRYPFAMVDEFQDTDSLQYEIFNTIYRARPQGGLMMIGDPKQAIYGFRGGDIFAYIRARRDAGANRYTLPTNFRSAPRLVKAVNAVFECNGNAFLHPEIPFEAVADSGEGGKKSVLLLDGAAPPAPLTCWLLENSSGDIADTDLSGTVDEALTQRCATEIHALLEKARQGRAEIVRRGERRALQAGDIAVLTRSNPQAQKIKAALDAAGIPNVCRLTQSIFKTTEADEVLAVLEACAEPGQDHLLLRALSTELMGGCATDLHHLLNDQQAWEAAVSRCHDYRQTWQQHGVLAMLQPLIAEAAPRLLTHAAGQRRLTDLLHLGELLEEASASSFGLLGLTRWLRRQIESAPEEKEDNDAAQLRLENDDKLVQILTIHSSKGLQYPVVFLPFLGRGKLDTAKSAKTAICHPDDDQLLVDLGSPELKAHLHLQAKEELAEAVRIAYVALTRAECRCYFAWGKIKQGEQSALAWLLHREDGCTEEGFSGPDGFPAFKKLSPAAVRERLERIREISGDSLELVELDVGAPIAVRKWQADATAATRLQARPLKRQPSDPWWTYSFSQLAKLGRGQVISPEFDLDEPEDDGEDTASVAVEVPQDPRGATFGECVHAIFEHIDFAAADAPPALELIATQCAKAGYQGEDAALIGAIIQGALGRELSLGQQGRTRLADLAPEDRVAEMEFYFPLKGMPVSALADALSQHDTYARSASALARYGKHWTGMMNGKIDLVFKHEGRFYIADYKTHALGTRFADYAPERLRKAAYDKQLDLQYLIYTLALHRHLRRHLPGYDYEQHFGGALYLFVRAMSEQAPADTGVHFDRPPYSLIAALDTIFASVADEEEALA